MLTQNLQPVIPVEVRISITMKSLWFDLVFVAGKQGRIVEACDTMWNHGHLTDWLESIVREEPCPVLEVDREGEIDRLEARYIDIERVHLVIADWEDAAHPFIDAVVSRKKLIWEIYSELQHWSAALKQSCRYKEQIEDQPDWLRLPSVEAWLKWPECNKSTFGDCQRLGCS